MIFTLSQNITQSQSDGIHHYLVDWTIIIGAKWYIIGDNIAYVPVNKHLICQLDDSFPLQKTFCCFWHHWSNLFDLLFLLQCFPVVFYLLITSKPFWKFFYPQKCRRCFDFSKTDVTKQDGWFFDKIKVVIMARLFSLTLLLTWRMMIGWRTTKTFCCCYKMQW